MDCPLYPTSFAPVFVRLKPFIARAGLTPYNVARKRGELTFLLLTESTQGGMMLSFVLLSTNKLEQLRGAAVVKTAAAGDFRQSPAGEYDHSGRRAGDSADHQSALAENFNQVLLYIRPQSFFQTNPQVAADLYTTARA